MSSLPQSPDFWMASTKDITLNRNGGCRTLSFPGMLMYVDNMMVVDASSCTVPGRDLVSHKG